MLTEIVNVMLFGAVGVLFGQLWNMNKKIDAAMQNVSLIADRSLADRIIQAERLKSAEERIRLYEREDKHMCLTPWCRKPVLGMFMFGHCEEHLDSVERRWADEEVETKGPRIISEDVHPIMRDALKQQLESDKERVQETCDKLIEAYRDAHRFRRADLERFKESRQFLPEALIKRIVAAEEVQEVSVGWQKEN